MMYKAKNTGPTNDQIDAKYAAQAHRTNSMPKYIGLRVTEYTPVETNAADVSGFRGLTVVLARRKDTTPPRAIAIPIAARTTASGRRICLGQLDEAGADVDAVHSDAAPSQLVGVPAGAAPDVEHAHPGFEPEHRDDVIDLLARPLGERVPQVRRPEMLGHRLKPVRVLVLPAHTPKSRRRRWARDRAISETGRETVTNSSLNRARGRGTVPPRCPSRA